MGGPVISPLIALMKPSGRHSRPPRGPTRGPFLELLPQQVRRRAGEARRGGGLTKLLYVAPESLTKARTSRFCACAHQLRGGGRGPRSEWGHDFRPEYRFDQADCEGHRQRPHHGVDGHSHPESSTGHPEEPGHDGRSRAEIVLQPSNLFYEVRPKKDALQQIVRHCLQHAGKSGIVYCLSRKRVEQIAETLRVNGVKALAYHAGMDSNQRSKIQDQFLMQDVDVIVATIAFGMGIDKPDVRFVMHYDMPKSLESYYQETGRGTRRRRRPLHCVLQPQGHRQAGKVRKANPLQNKRYAIVAGSHGLRETATSRRKFLLHYFGEEFDEENGPGAKNCDNTQNPPTLEDRQEDAHLVLSAVLEHKNKHRMVFYTALLTATKTAKWRITGQSRVRFGAAGNRKDWTIGRAFPPAGRTIT